MTARIERLTTSGMFSLDGEDFEVQNNVWLLGDDDEVIVIDAAHEALPILAAIGYRRLRAVVCTHGHNDHINAAAQVADAKGAPIWMHPDDAMLWEVVYPERRLDDVLRDGMTISVGGADARVIHTPGHSPGGSCLHVAELGTVFSGDTLFHGGPGATGRSFSDYGTILDSIERGLMSLDDGTVVHTGHGADTSIGAERPSLPEWRAKLAES